MNVPQPSKNWITLAAGHFFVLLGILGVILPVIPASPFLILAAYFYNKGHPHFHQRLMNFPKLGPVLRDWDERKVLRLPAKLGTSFTIALLCAWPLYFGRHHLSVMILIVAFALTLITYIMTRKSK